jgi:hypothetical protein
MLSTICAVGEADTEEAAQAYADSLVDPLGTFYRFSLPASLLRRSRR